MAGAVDALIAPAAGHVLAGALHAVLDEERVPVAPDAERVGLDGRERPARELAPRMQVRSVPVEPGRQVEALEVEVGVAVEPRAGERVVVLAQDLLGLRELEEQRVPRLLALL